MRRHSHPGPHGDYHVPPPATEQAAQRQAERQSGSAPKQPAPEIKPATRQEGRGGVPHPDQPPSADVCERPRPRGSPGTAQGSARADAAPAARGVSFVVGREAHLRGRRLPLRLRPGFREFLGPTGGREAATRLGPRES
ncbi:uncharacterized protein LOC119580761 [Penaeus monodon]|uniref:uncharacterized protein LOC119580761 n=1 Tax=Penaeus monodon TaxID=6687 RepID=UPI0018A6DDCD|nr:uncharacterized protein LOC119580761 [Penaeus monodon]